MRTYIAIMGICWIVFILFWVVSSFSAKKTARSGGWRKGAALRIVMALILFLLIKAGVFAHVSFVQMLYLSNPIAAPIGVIFTIVGVSLAIWARMYLGKNWGMPMTLKGNPELVTTGPYAYVRHPIYTGMILAVFGPALTITPWWLAICILVLGYFIYSATQEEKIMAREFPGTYPEYKRKSKMLIPYVF